MPDKGISGARHSVGRFRGSVASVGVLWRSGRSALLGAFGRVGVGESVGITGEGVERIAGGLVWSAGSQLIIRNLSGTGFWDR